MARAPVSKTGGWGFESLHSCQAIPLKSLQFEFGAICSQTIFATACYHLSANRGGLATRSRQRIS
jgi:hypothetical protein